MNPAVRADRNLARQAQGPSILDQDGKPMAAAYIAGSTSHEDMRRWMPYPGSANSDLLSELGTIRSRTRDIDRNHGVAAGVAQTNVDNVVGTGLRLKSRPAWKALGWTEEQAEEWSNIVEARWCAYSESTWFDAARTVNFDFGTRLVFRSAFNNGEALALPLWLPEPGAPAGTRFQIVEPDRLCNPNHQPDREGMLGGKELDAYGAAVAYHIRKSHPGDRYSYDSGFSTDTVRVPAFTDWGRPRVLHIFDQTRPGMTRGVPALASVLRQFKVLSDYSNAELKAAVVNAMIALITESALGQEQLVELLSNDTAALKKYQDSLAQRDRASIEFTGGMVLPLQLGEKASGFTPARPNQAFEPFVLALFRQIAAGLNIPYELLLKDFSQTNYSSARAALLEAWRFFKGRRKWLAACWAQPVFELWFEEEANEGRIEAPDFYEKRALYCRTKWIGDGRGWIDPLKEAQAAELRMKCGITTLEDECAEQGTDWEEVIEVRARIEKRARAAGVILPSMAEYSYTAPVPERELQPGEEPSAQPAGKPADRPAGNGNAHRAPTIQNHVEVVPESFAAALEKNSQAVIAFTEQVKESAHQTTHAITAASAQQTKETNAEISRQAQSVKEASEAQSARIEALAANQQRSDEAFREAALRQGGLIMALAESIKELGKATERGLQAVAQTSLLPTRAVFDAKGDVIGTVKVASLEQE